MTPYIHKVQYYETDKMGVTHHSNYIRWMEEARMDFLTRIGHSMKKFEAASVTSPVVSLECRYIKPSTYDDEIAVTVTVKKYTGVRLVLGYAMVRVSDGLALFAGSSTHCFINGNGRPVPIAKLFPAFDAAMRELAENRPSAE